MNNKFKRMLAAFVAASCLAPLATVHATIGQDEKALTYNFELTDGVNLIDTTKTEVFGVDGAVRKTNWTQGEEWLTDGYAGNNTGVLKITAPPASGSTFVNNNTYVQCYHLSKNLSYKNDDGSRRYMIAKFKVYTDGEGLEYISLGNEWGDRTSIGVSMEGTKWSNPEYADASYIPVPGLEKNKWNEVVYVTYFDNKHSDGSYTRYDTYSDIYVNGKLIGEGKKYTNARNPHAVGQVDDEHLAVRLILRSKYTTSPTFASEGFTVYLDDVSLSVSDSPLAIPSLAESDKYEINSDKTVVSVFAGTTPSALKAKNSDDTVTVYNGSTQLGASDTLSAGNTVVVTNAHGIKKEYTVKIITPELSAKDMSLTYSTDGSTQKNLERFGGELKKAEYSYKAKIKNVTGEEKNIGAILARYNSNGTLTSAEISSVKVKSKIDTQDIEVNLEVKDEPSSGEYIKGFLFDMSSMKPLADAYATNKRNGSLKVLIIGNSITKHEYAAGVGWYGNWGMAATSEDKDFVHILQKNIKEIHPDAEFKVTSVWDFERYFYNFDNITDSKFKEYVDFDADIIVSAFGANINNANNENDPTFESGRTFSVNDYINVINYFDTKNDARIIPVLTPLTKTVIADEILKLPEAKGWTLVNTADLTDQKYTAYPYRDAEVFGANVTDGVLNHPGDLGMQVIAERIWEALKDCMD